MNGEPFLSPIKFAPKGFPSEYLPVLSEFMADGFNEAIRIARLGKKARGRPINQKARDQGREAKLLREQGLTYGQIATRLCLERREAGHTCGKTCADLIRQRSKLASKL